MNYVEKILVWALLLLFPAISALGNGNMSGVVKSKSGETLPGATVVIKGTTLGTSTDLSGSYTLQGIPDGKNIILVSYIGYKPLEMAINIVNNAKLTHNFILEEDAIELAGVYISGALKGQQRALNQQKVADNLMQVVSADQMGRFPDINVSDALRRLSGVTSDGKEIQLRGTPANFTNININGEQIMGSQEGGKRNESMDVIPTDILSSMEVQKTLLPSNDGDAIAGVINMRTGIARSLKPSFSIDLGSAYTVIRDKAGYNAKFSYAQRFFRNDKNQDGVLGLKVNYSYMLDHDGYDRLEAEAWEPYNLIDNTTGEVVKENYYIPTDMRLRYQQLKSTRNGMSLAIDIAPTKYTKFVLSTMYNNRKEEGDRYRFRSRFRSNGDGFYLMEDGSIGSKRMRYVSQVTASDEKVNNLNINLDGETSFRTWKIDGALFYSKSERDYTSEMDGFQTPEWRAGKKVNGVKIAGDAIIGTVNEGKYLSYNNLYVPTGNMGDAAIDDVSRFNLYTQENWNYNSGGDNFTAKLNANKNYFIKGNASTFSFGAKGKFMGYNGKVPEGTNDYAITASDNNNLTNLLYKSNMSSNFLNGHYTNFGPVPDISKVRSYFSNSANSGDISVNEYSSGVNRDGYYYDSHENVLSGYLMNKIQFNKRMFLTGFRFERTHVDYKALKIDPFVNPEKPVQNGDETLYNDYTATPVESSLHYSKFLPNIQFKYAMSDNTIFRLAWTTGYSRPNISDLVPKQEVSQDLQRITIGNPDLKPAYAHNLDLLFEKYLPNVGLISGGVFYKNIKNFIYTSEGIVEDGTSTYNGWQVIQSKNGNAANLLGAEITLNSGLAFVSDIFKSLLFTGNYTYIHSKAKSSLDREAMRLPGQAKSTGNIALAYSDKYFTLQVAMNYIGSYIESLGSSAERDIWRNDRWQMDINGSVNLGKGVSFWAEAVNVLNSESYTYFGNKNNVYNLQYNGARARCGFTYKF